MVSLASLSTMIGSWQFLEKDEIKEWKATLPVQGHVRVRVGKRKTSVWSSEIFHVILLRHHPQGLVKKTLQYYHILYKLQQWHSTDIDQAKSDLRPAIRLLMLTSARAERARAP